MAGYECNHKLHQYQDNDCQFQRLALFGSYPVREDLVEGADDVQFVRYDPSPVPEMKALGGSRMDPCQIRISDQFQGVLYALSQNQGLGPHLRQLLQRLLIRSP